MRDFDLKPCPFCGGEAKLSRGKVTIRGWVEQSAWVYCRDCGIKTNYMTRSSRLHYMKDAVDTWNRRVNDD